MKDNLAQIKSLHITRNPFKSYAERPSGVSYQDLERDEQVALLLRRHPITNFRWLFLAILAAFIPILIKVVPMTGFELQGLPKIPGDVQFLLGLFWYTLILGYALQNFLIWYYNVYLVTNLRIVDVDFHGLMHYASDEAALHQIQDVSHNQSGLWQLLFGFGTVHLQTSGTRQNLDFERVPLPARVADVVTDLLPLPEDVRYGQVTVGQSAHSKSVASEANDGK